MRTVLIRSARNPLKNPNFKLHSSAPQKHVFPANSHFMVFNVVSQARSRFFPGKPLFLNSYLKLVFQRSSMEYGDWLNSHSRLKSSEVSTVC